MLRAVPARVVVDKADGGIKAEAVLARMAHVARLNWNFIIIYLKRGENCFATKDAQTKEW